MDVSAGCTYIDCSPAPKRMVFYTNEWCILSGQSFFFCPQLFVHRRWIIVHNMVYVYANIAYMIILFQFGIHFFPLIFEWWTSFKWWTKQCISVEIFWEFCLLFIPTHFYLLFSLCTRANPSIMQTQFHLANWNVSR